MIGKEVVSAYPAYNYDSTARQQQEFERFDIEVVPGGGRDAAKQPSIDPVIAVFARVLIAVVVVFASIGGIRITLSSATIAAAMEANQISTSIEEARAAGSAYEVQQSTLSNPTRIKGEATGLGMSTPDQTVFISMPADIVAKDAEGNLSLSGSMAALAGE